MEHHGATTNHAITEYFDLFDLLIWKPGSLDGLLVATLAALLLSSDIFSVLQFQEKGRGNGRQRSI